jgi:hypothetical protein
MNMRLKSTANIPPTWDIDVDEFGNAIYISGEEEELQNAQVATFLPKGSTPQLSEDVYPDWLGWLTEEVPFGELDSQIRNSIELSGSTDYYPEYSLENGKNLTVTMRKD